MTVESQEELTKLRAIGHIVALTIQEIGKNIRPGISTLELDEIGKRFLAKHGANSAPQKTYNFPGVTCISVNEEAAHGIPGARIIEDGDLVNIDVSAERDGFFADAGHTFCAGTPTEEGQRLCQASQEALEEAMKAARANQRLNLIGKAVERVARQYGYKTLRDLGGHGIGRGLHEAPSFIANFYDRRDSRRLLENQVITIEPFLSTRSEQTHLAEDGWTLLTKPQNRCAQFEHTMVITQNQPIILTSLEPI